MDDDMHQSCPKRADLFALLPRCRVEEGLLWDPLPRRSRRGSFLGDPDRLPPGCLHHLPEGSRPGVGGLIGNGLSECSSTPRRMTPSAPSCAACRLRPSNRMFCVAWTVMLLARVLVSTWPSDSHLAGGSRKSLTPPGSVDWSRAPMRTGDLSRSQLVHFRGPHGEALAVLAGAPRFDGRVERQEVRPAGEVVDEDNLVGVLRHDRHDLFHGLAAFGVLPRRPGRDAAGHLGVLAVLRDRGALVLIDDGLSQVPPGLWQKERYRHVVQSSDPHGLCSKSKALSPWVCRNPEGRKLGWGTSMAFRKGSRTPAT